MAKGESTILYVRMDDETALALKLQCFRMGTKKQSFVFELLRRELGLDRVPDPDPGKAHRSPEVEPPELGKAEAESPPESLPTTTSSPTVNPPDQPILPTPEREQESFSLSPVHQQKELRKVARRFARKLPDDFHKTPGLLEYAEGQGVFNAQFSLLQFCDYHIARGTIFLDWLAAWRTWCRNQIQYQQKHAPNVLSTHRNSEKMRVADQIFGTRNEVEVIDAVSTRRLPA